MKKNDADFAYCGAGDTRLEGLIEAQRVKLVGASTREERRDAWYLMKALIESRSAQRIRQMEVARGICR